MKAGEVAAFILGGLVERIAHAGVPERLFRIAFLMKRPRLWVDVGLCGLLAVPHGEIADAQDPATVLALGPADVLVPDALVDFDRGGVEVHMLPFQPQHLRNPRARGDAGFNNELVGFFTLNSTRSARIKRCSLCLGLVFGLKNAR